MSEPARPSGRIPISSIIGAAGPIGGWITLIPTLGKGPTRAWTIAHLLLLAGWAAYLPIIVDFQRRVPPTARRWSRPSVPLAALGVPLMLGQLLVDLLAAYHASTQAEMDFFFGRLRATPQLAIPLYHAAPPLVYTGLLLQSVDGVRSGQLRRWTAVLLMLGVLLIAGDQGRYRYRLGLVGQLLCGIGLLRMSRSVAPPSL